MWAKRGPECMSLSEPKPRRNPLLPVQCLTIRGPSYSRCPNAKRPVKSWGGNSGKIRGASNQAWRAQDCLRAGGSRGAAYTIPPSSPYKREQLNTAQEPGTHTGSCLCPSAVPENPVCLAQLANHIQGGSTGQCPGPAGQEAWVGT